MQAPDNTTKLGRLFSWISWLLLLALLYWFFEDQISLQINPNQQLQSQIGSSGEKVTILKRNKAGHYVGTALFNGVPMEFMLDTGATVVAVSEQAALKLGMPRGQRYQVSTANGPAAAYDSRLNSLQLGDIVLTEIRASITPGLHGTDILLGMSALKQLEFSQQQDELKLIQR
ncbi:TIGR02281 family clan AA aspartic protease [Rheinheimera soli]|jgi:aspartyl protease family protein|uniref:Aspartyl protease family protein n=1 Tax=Rheinheimera soli TaxID=443616 RepID=A0ABU1W3R7_9GAMM|nr:TIGR02281 family clan AA aspartic protease [Rheinheimera soli]MDR7122624.1 aspartyl protease family protein [Rheinheimera soli]